jgi:hypothetical protein
LALVKWHQKCYNNAASTKRAREKEERVKQHEYRARLRTARKRERSEFALLEAYINTGEWEPGPFMVYAKKVHHSVATSDGSPPPLEAAIARARHLSNRRWPRDKYEGKFDGKSVGKKEG